MLPNLKCQAKGHPMGDVCSQAHGVRVAQCSLRILQLVWTIAILTRVVDLKKRMFPRSILSKSHETALKELGQLVGLSSELCH